MRFRRLSGALTLALALLAGGGILAGAALAQGSADIFTVRDVPVDETAATAADARQAALAVGQRRAFRRLMERLVPEDQQDRVPSVESSTLQYYVQDFSVNNERTSTVRYLADLTFRFNGDEVRSFLRNAGVGFAETRSKPVVVLPVFSGPGTDSALWLADNPWRDVWALKPGDDGLVPLIVPIGDLDDLAAIDAPRALNGDPESLKAIAERYGADDVLVTAASLAGDPQDGSAVLEVVTRRYHDGAASVTLRDKLIQVSGEPYDGFLKRGADRIDDAVQEAWKQQYVLQFGNQRSILVYVPLTGLDDWLKVRKRLDGVAAIQQAHTAGLPIVAHAIGDAAIDQALRAVERAVGREGAVARAGDAAPAVGRRHRIEHCGFTSAEQIARMARLGMVPAPQPIFLYEFGELYREVLGEARPAAAYPMRAWSEAGLRPIASSDTPVSDFDPMKSLYAMVTRRTDRGRVLGADQRLDLATAITAATANGAYGSFSETVKGTLEPGRLADVAVLERDVFACPPEALLETRVDLTILNGEIVYDRQGEMIG